MLQSIPNVSVSNTTQRKVRHSMETKVRRSKVTKEEMTSRRVTKVEHLHAQSRSQESTAGGVSLRTAIRTEPFGGVRQFLLDDLIRSSPGAKEAASKHFFVAVKGPKRLKT